MDIVSNREMLIEARKDKYAIPAFNIHNLETMQGVIEAAYELRSPLMIATTPGTIKYAGLEFIVAMVKVAAKKYDIPIALHLDHCTDVELLKQCIKAGYKSVMIDASSKSYEENISISREIVRYSHRYEVSVEAELGLIGGQEDERNIEDKDIYLTDPKNALDFIQKTNVDSLAISIGTAHGVYKSEPKLDFERLAKINNMVTIPLVLHGASGVPNESLIKAIGNGISKVNVATELKIPFAEAIKKYFKENPDANDPRDYLAPARDMVKQIAMEKIKICKSLNRY